MTPPPVNSKILAHFVAPDFENEIGGGFSIVPHGQASPVSVPGKFGLGVLLNGTENAGAGCITEDALDFFASDFCIEFWAKGLEITLDRAQIIAATPGENKNVLAIYGTGLTVFSTTAVSPTHDAIPGLFLDDDTAFHLYSISKQGGTLRGFRDGVLIGEYDATDYFGAVSSVVSFFVAVDETIGFNGTIDEFLVVHGSAYRTAPFSVPTEGHTNEIEETPAMRDFANSILSFIGAESLTDAEYEAFTDLEPEYSEAVYNALRAVLEGRDGVSNSVDRLNAFFFAHGADFVQPTPSPTSNIFLGASLA